VLLSAPFFLFLNILFLLCLIHSVSQEETVFTGRPKLIVSQNGRQA
jgi:hypothetical protein